MREYAAAKNLKGARAKRNIGLIGIIAVMSITSARRFIEGGAAILHLESRNHHIIRAGKREPIPWMSESLRVLTAS